jgi:hypothetical protein
MKKRKKYLLLALIILGVLFVGWKFNMSSVDKSDNEAGLMDAVKKIFGGNGGVGVGPGSAGYYYGNNWDGPCWDEYVFMNKAKDYWKLVNITNRADYDQSARNSAYEQWSKAAQAYNECVKKQKPKR